MRQKRIFPMVFGCIVGAIFSIYGLIAFLGLFTDVQKKIASIPSQTEGYCLTDLVKNTPLKPVAMAEYFKDACVSIILENESGVAWGSGVSIASCGYEIEEGVYLESGSFIMTNYHVMQPYIEDNSFKVSVYPNRYDDLNRYPEGTAPFAGELLWYDSYLDMAIVYTAESLDWVRMKDRVVSEDTLYEVNSAFVIGSPYVEEKNIGGVLHRENPIACVDFNKATFGDVYYEYDGVYTVEDDSMTDISNVYEDLILMNIEIHPGNSGGGLFDSSGYLIGQPTLSSEEENSFTFSNSIYPYTIVLPKLVKAKQQFESAKFYGLKDLSFSVVDYYENTIIIEHYELNFALLRDRWVKYNGNAYWGDLFSAYSITQKGLKVIYPDNKVSTNAFLTAVFVNGEKYVFGEFSEYGKRNELIYLLLQCEKGDVLTFQYTNNEDSRLPVSITLN